jgi:hypothetical protein
MKCYVHNENESIGICKACQKAVCASCAVDTGRGLACSEECKNEVSDLNAIIDKSKRIYSIGSKPKLLPTNILMYFLFSILFFAWGIYNSLNWDRIDFFTMIMGVGFFIIGLIAYSKNKTINLNC